MGINGDRPFHWYQGLTKYHWWVLAIGALSWMFDCMDQRIFVLSRASAVKELMDWDAYKDKIQPEIAANAAKEVQKEIDAGTLVPDQRESETRKRVDQAFDSALKKKASNFGDIVTALMMVGWSVGGFFFGIYGDRLGRVKTLSITIGVYSIFTGLSGLATGIPDFCIYRFLEGCGIGGAFAAAATLIAETMPNHARAAALGIFQALSSVGNLTGSLIARYIVEPEVPTNLFGLIPGEGIAGWRVLFMIGVIPAVLVAIIMRSIKEPEAWQTARATAADNLERQLGDIKSLFRTPRWRRNTLVGLSLAVVGVIGLWGVGFYTPELLDEALTGYEVIEKSHITSTGMVLQDIGSLLGMLAFTYVATRMGRRLAFGMAFVFCWVIVSGVFLFLTQDWHVYVMLPLVGFATLSVFGGYSIYFPELYPARLRSSGTGFCYNVGRLFSAVVILFKIPIGEAFASAGFTEVFRYVAIALTSIYLLGLLILIWAPETKDKPLPTDEDVE